MGDTWYRELSWDLNVGFYNIIEEILMEDKVPFALF